MLPVLHVAHGLGIFTHSHYYVSAASSEYRQSTGEQQVNSKAPPTSPLCPKCTVSTPPGSPGAAAWPGCASTEAMFLVPFYSPASLCVSPLQCPRAGRQPWPQACRAALAGLKFSPFLCQSCVAKCISLLIQPLTLLQL